MLTYTISELPPPAGADPPFASAAEDVNTDGVAAGSAVFRGPGDHSEAVVWPEHASPTVLEMPPPDTLGWAINDAGDAVGYLRHPPVQPFLYHHDTGLIEDFSAALPGPESWVFDLNNDRIVTGASGRAVPNVPFVYEGKNGSVTLLETVPGRRVLPTAINEAGHVAGFSATDDLPPDPHALIYRDGTMQDLGPAGEVADVNNHDVIVGTAYDLPQAFPGRAFRLDASVPHPSLELISPPVPVPGYTCGSAINDDGVVVGWWQPEGEKWRAFVDIPSGVDAGFHELQDVVVEADDWQLLGASGISNTGYIVGFGWYQEKYRGFLLTPAPDYWLKKEFEKVREVLLGLLGIFGGATVGGPGWGLLPGGKPVPIDPHGPMRERWEQLTEAERDFYLGLAIQHLDSIVSGDERGEIVQKAGRQIVESARKELESKAQEMKQRDRN
jgi:probable HAF family extracellular repeat protein